MKRVSLAALPRALNLVLCSTTALGDRREIEGSSRNSSKSKEKDFNMN